MDAPQHLQQLFALVESNKFYMRLGTMQFEDLERLVCHQLDVESIPAGWTALFAATVTQRTAALVQFITKKSEGNPLFAREFSADLLAKGYIRVEVCKGADAVCPLLTNNQSRALR